MDSNQADCIRCGIIPSSEPNKACFWWQQLWRGKRDAVRGVLPELNLLAMLYNTECAGKQHMCVLQPFTPKLVWNRPPKWEYPLLYIHTDASWRAAVCSSVLCDHSQLCPFRDVSYFSSSLFIEWVLEGYSHKTNVLQIIEHYDIPKTHPLENYHIKKLYAIIIKI